jgi:hypothetical protein
MKKVIPLLIVIVLATLLGYNYLSTGRLTLIPGAALSDEEKQLASLEKALRAAERSFAQAGRAAGMAGIDTTADAEAALRDVEMIDKQLKDMKKSASSEAIKTKIERLERQVAEVKRKMGAR